MPICLADLTDPTHQAAIVALLDMYSGDEFGDGRPLSDEARTRLIPGLIEHGKARVFLAYADGEPVGLAICLVGFSSFRGRPLLNIHDIAVAPQARSRGIGQQLLEAIEQDARAIGCCRVTLEVRSDNHRAMQLYRRLGFCASQPETWFWTRTLE